MLVLVELINDEEDDDLSNKAYQCLENMGTVTVFELLKKSKELLEQRERVWKKGNTIMLDVFMRRERHVYVEPIQ